MQSKSFPLFGNPTGLAHLLWRQLLVPGDLAIDATCGNGLDTEALLQMGARVIAIDIQPAAIRATEQRVGARAQMLLASHEMLPLVQPKLVVYNLGYLPGGDKSLTTRAEITLQSVRHATHILAPQGVISIMAYPGHTEGSRELAALVPFLQTLHPTHWFVTEHSCANRQAAPHLLLLQRQ